MFQLTYLLLSQLALAEQPTLSPIKTIGPKSLPPKLQLDGSSPVLEEQRRQREEAEEEAANNSSSDSTTSSQTNNSASPGEIRIGSNMGAVPANYASINGASTVEFNFPQGIELMQLIKMMAQATGRNFILGNDIKGSVTVISHKPLTVPEAYEAFLSILEVSGYTTVAVGKNLKIVSTSGASNSPLRYGYDGAIPSTDNFITQIIQLENVTVSDISPIVKDLSGKSAKIITYAPTNTLIITDAGVNIKRVYDIISKMDVAAPKSQMRIIPLQHATASDVQQIINDLYGDDGSSTSNSKSSSRSSSSSSRRRSKSKRKTAASADATNVGSEEKYIEKIISDERTNSLIVMANENALETITQLIKDLDVDVDPASRAQIHVVYLEHAKAEDIAQVLSNLSNNTSGNSRNSSRSNSRNNSRNN